MGQIVMVSIVYLQFFHDESCYNQLQVENIFYFDNSLLYPSGIHATPSQIVR